MCDTVAGELLLSMHRDDPAGRLLMEQIAEGEISHVRLDDSLSGRLRRLDLRPREGLQLEFFRLLVPEGEEIFKISYLQFFYKHAMLQAFERKLIDPLQHREILSRSDLHLQIVPNSILSVREVPSGLGFQFTPFHDDYKRIFGWRNSSSTSHAVKRVLILDTGLDPAVGFQGVAYKNFVDPDNPKETADDHGHGTAVSSIIHDLCPSAELVVYKVADAEGRASEWDTLAALATNSGADILNISLAFGLPGTYCPTCGRESHNSRSAVFENMVEQLAKSDHDPFLLAAAGNEGKDKLSFPARFSSILALISINEARELSTFTNRSAIDHVGDPHPNVFVLPGGEEPAGAAATEYVGTCADGSRFFGTSFSTAYASGLIAALWSDPRYSWMSRLQLLDHLKGTADNQLPNFSPLTHGHGMLRFA
jgi:subtilase family protein